MDRPHEQKNSSVTVSRELGVPTEHLVPGRAVEMMAVYVLGAQPWFRLREWDSRALMSDENPPNQMTYAYYLSLVELRQDRSLQEINYYKKLRCVVLASRMAFNYLPAEETPLFIPEKFKPLEQNDRFWRYAAGYYRSGS